LSLSKRLELLTEREVLLRRGKVPIAQVRRTLCPWGKFHVSVEHSDQGTREVFFCSGLPRCAARGTFPRRATGTACFEFCGLGVSLWREVLFILTPATAICVPRRSSEATLRLRSVRVSQTPSFLNSLEIDISHAAYFGAKIVIRRIVRVPFSPNPPSSRFTSFRRYRYGH